MVGISIKSMALLYVKGHKPSTTMPIIHPSGISVLLGRQLLLHSKLGSQVKAGVYLAGQKTWPDWGPCRTELMTIALSDNTAD